MTTITQVGRISWLLAEHLKGMRDAVHEISRTCLPNCPGYSPAQLTTEGLIDEGRLRRAILHETGFVVQFNEEGKNLWSLWLHRPAIASPDLAIAYLKAKGVWTETAHRKNRAGAPWRLMA